MRIILTLLLFCSAHSVFGQEVRGFQYHVRNEHVLLELRQKTPLYTSSFFTSNEMMVFSASYYAPYYAQLMEYRTRDTEEYIWLESVMQMFAEWMNKEDPTHAHKQWSITFLKGSPIHGSSTYEGRIFLDITFLERLSRDEQMFVLGHEMYHAYAGHTLQDFDKIAGFLAASQKPFSLLNVAAALDSDWNMQDKLEDLVEQQELQADAGAQRMLDSLNLSTSGGLDYVTKLYQRGTVKTFYAHADVGVRWNAMLKICSALESPVD